MDVKGHYKLGQRPKEKGISINDRFSDEKK